ncbi:MAG: dTMP kinase [Marinicaulis sp.]|nr:dTMP kinase [Marinicaulis sp.]NNL87746.1 dTMP kinase [Marinicaulis sp.]
MNDADNNNLYGRFISFEGGDGVGKSTQIKHLAKRLKASGANVVVTREPGGSIGAEAIRELLVTGDKNRWSPLTEALLMNAARRDHVETTIIPALERGDTVITDRFADSTMAYQGYAGEIGVDTVATLETISIGDCRPDLTLILNAPVKTALERADTGGGEGRFEAKGQEFQETVRNAFLEIAKNNPDRCVVINAAGTIDEVAERIWAAVCVRWSSM